MAYTFSLTLIVTQMIAIVVSVLLLSMFEEHISAHNWNMFYFRPLLSTIDKM